MSGKVNVKTRCPVCSAKYRVPVSSLGHRARCAKCRTTFRVAGIEDSRRPTEDDILRWLNEGMDEDDMLSQPRVVSGGSEVQPAPGESPAADEPEPRPTRVVEDRPPPLRHVPTGPASALPDEEAFFRKTG